MDNQLLQNHACIGDNVSRRLDGILIIHICEVNLHPLWNPN